MAMVSLTDSTIIV